MEAVKPEKKHPEFADGLKFAYESIKKPVSLDQIEKLKRYTLDQLVMKIERKTGVFTPDFESLYLELDQKKIINLSSLLSV
jgi:hypothetical protein